MKREENLGVIAPGKRVGSDTLRHSIAQHLLMNGIPINYLSRWLVHSSIQATLIYLDLVPNPTGSLAMVGAVATPTIRYCGELHERTESLHNDKPCR